MSNVIEISQPASKLFTVDRHANTNISGDMSLVFLKEKQDKKNMLKLKYVYASCKMLCGAMVRSFY